jgi:aquaporin Z
MIRKLVVEFVGVAFLVFTIGMVVLEPGAGAMAPLAIGAVLMVMVYAGAHVSGAHYNPAVTVAVWIRGLTNGREALRYWAAQLLGAFVGAGIAVQMKGDGAATPLVLDLGNALAAEFLFTFALAWVVLNVATAYGTEGNSYFGLAIGFTVLAGAYAVGGISGGAFNPAVAFGLVMMGIAGYESLWIYFAAELAGAVAAALAFNALVLAADKPTTATAAQQRSLEPPGSTGE